ncbi:SDR family oxidoreductase [Rhodococcus sp. NPDC003318]|uniref:SDR family oxidoreductase n=1 Tax=Rhodococcus sp. NPDC003318 TaxID=3364503 RepID=UPI0036A4D9D0
MARVVVIGGHGKVALHLERILTARGDEVTALIRNPEHAADVAATGARPQTADIENLSTDEITDVLRGHDAVVWSAGAGGGNPARTYAVDRDAAIRSMDAAAAAGVRRYVMVSYLGARTDHGVPQDNSFFAYAEAKAAADEYLRTTRLDWTVLGPGTLTLEPGTGRIEVAAKPAAGSVSREDVAAVAAAALGDPTTIGRTIPFNSGPTPIAHAISG